MMKDYYLNRFKWIFNYTSTNFWYILAKTLCIIVGLPIYSVVFLVEMLLTFVNMLFCWIPVLRVVITIICKGTILIIDKLYYICILTDLGKFRDTVMCVEEEDRFAEGVDYTVYDGEDNSAEGGQTDQLQSSQTDELDSEEKQ